jgi:hypothetical protein
MPTPAQLQKIWQLSDSVLYPEAVAFVHRLVNEEECSPLPASQVTGLLNIANAASFSELGRFIRHQRERNWPEAKKDIKTFYTELEKLLTKMKNKRIKGEFQLIREGLSSKETSREIDELMALLSHDFIQHLVAENGLLAVKKATERAKRR